jgi:hypothetical protein
MVIIRRRLGGSFVQRVRAKPSGIWHCLRATALSVSLNPWTASSAYRLAVKSRSASDMAYTVWTMTIHTSHFSNMCSSSVLPRYFSASDIDQRGPADSGDKSGYRAYLSGEKASTDSDGSDVLRATTALLAAQEASAARKACRTRRCVLSLIGLITHYATLVPNKCVSCHL